MRPRRAASQKVQQQQQKEIEEDDEDELNLSEASSGDFSSQSSDDWDPTKLRENKINFADSESEDIVSEVEEEAEQSFEESLLRKAKIRKRNPIASLRGTTSNKFKPNRSQNGSNANIRSILQKAEYQKKKSIFDETQESEEVPEFDCSGGLRLSDSDDSDYDGPSTSAAALEMIKPKTSALINNINQASGSKMVDLKSIHDNLKQMEDVKAKLINYKNSKSTSQKNSNDKQNVADLLAMGEAASDDKSQTKSKKSSQKRNRHAADDSESDGWEEVEDDGESREYKVPKHGVEIVLNDMNQQEGKKKETKPVDFEAQMKRKLNRRRKEFQVDLHKVNLMLWIGHGNFINRRINDTNLLANALQLLPKNKNHCYPKDKTDLDYFQQITNWFKSTIGLKNREMYCNFKPRPPIMMSLALQMKFKAAICRRDFVLIFAIILRAIGIQCRIVSSLVLAPIYPPKSDLLSLSGKKPSLETSKSAGNSKSAKSNNKLGKQAIIPQLDGGDDEVGAKRSNKNKKGIKIKGPVKNTIDESFVNLNKEDSAAKAPSPRKTRSKKGKNVVSSTKMLPTDECALNSPNSNQASPSTKLFKARKSAAPRLERLKVSENENFSPRKTRSKSKDLTPAPSASKSSTADKKSKENETKSKQDGNKLQVFSPRRLRRRSADEASDTKDKNSSEKKKSEKVVKDTLKVFSPRRLRSRSKSSEASSTTSANNNKKPQLKNLQKREDRKRESNEEIKIKSKKAKVAVKSGKVSSKKAQKRKSNDDFSEESAASAKYFKTAKKSKKTLESIDRRVLSSDSEDNAAPSISNSSPSKKSKGIDIWVEVYSEKDKRWISIDVFRGKVDCPKDIMKTATHPMTYVFAWNNDNSIKDVSARYCPNLNTTIRKMRVEAKYLNSILYHFAGGKTVRDVKEDNELNKLQLAKPMPTSIAEFKNHPLYALKRHLLKYEALFPAEPPILGYIREEAIYPRDCVFVLHTRETWLKEARVVKLNEKPYKMTKTLKWDNVTRKLLKDIPQELYGVWQTKDYEPPVAENGIVPRNAYGNVELFKPCMLPKGTVHLQLPGLNKVCKKLGIDCSQAIVGFDSNGGWPFPVYDGFIICEEFQEKVLDAWNRHQEEQEQKENEKFEKRVYGNWKKLIKGLLIRQRLKNKYNFESNK